MTSNQARLVNIVLNSFTSDSRVLRAAQLGKSLGYQSTVLALHEESLPKFEQQDEVNVVRIALLSRSLSKIRLVQIFKYFEFMVRTVFWALKHRPNLVHANDLAALPIAYVLKLVLQCKIVYDAHELWEECNHKQHFPKSLFNLAIKLERQLCRRSDSVITVCEGISNYMAKSHSIAPPTVVRNTPNAPSVNRSSTTPIRDALNLSANEKIVIFQGVIAKDRGLEVLVESFKYCDDENLVLVILGNGPLVAPLKELSQTLGLSKRVFFLPAVPPDQVINWTRDADIGVYSLPVDNICLSYFFGLPNKLFEFIQGGLAIIVSNLPEMRAIVEQYNLGPILESTAPTEIAKAITKISSDHDKLNNYKKSSRIAAQTLCWEVESRRLAAIYSALVPIQI